MKLLLLFVVSALAHQMPWKEIRDHYRTNTVVEVHEKRPHIHKLYPLRRTRRLLVEDKCHTKKIKVTGSNLYRGSDNSPLNELNGVYKIGAKNAWSKTRKNGKIDYIQWTADIFGATGWVLHGETIQYYVHSNSSCPTGLSPWRHLKDGLETKPNAIKQALLLQVVTFKDLNTATVVQDIRTMIAHIHPTAIEKVNNYGCTGIGMLDASTPAAGAPVDEFDRAINKWKQCTRCAERTLGSTYDPYIFDHNNNVCCKLLI